MSIKLDNNLANTIQKAVLYITNSIRVSRPDLEYRYKASIALIYNILAILYFEKNRIIQDKLHKQILHTSSSDSISLFNNVIDFQLRLIDTKNKLFSDYEYELSEEYFPALVKTLKKIISLDSLNIESFGYLYEYLQHYQLVNNQFEKENAVQLKLNLGKADYKYIIIQSGTGKKKQGSFFTPPELIYQLINSGLTEKLEEITSLNELLNFKVLDPACGGGNILLEIFFHLRDKALSRLNQSISVDDIEKLILKNCIFGVDIDKFACDIARLTLFLASGKQEHFNNIISGNFLIENLEKYSHNLDNKDLFRSNSSKFSLIIGNPPYLNIQNIPEVEKKYYLKNYISTYRRFDTYLLFIEKSLASLLKETGILAFIVPNKFLTQSYGKKLRELILDNHSVKEIISYKNQNLFNKASVLPIIIKIESGKTVKNLIKISEVSEKGNKVSTVSQDSYRNMHNFAFRVSWNTQVQEIIEIIQSKSFPLYRLCYVSWGAQPGDAKKFIFNNYNLSDSSCQSHLKPLIRGGNLARYKISYSGDYLLYLTDGDLKLHRPAFPELFESEKLTIAEVTANKGIIASLDDRGYYTNHSIINCIHKKNLINLNTKDLKTRGIKLINTGKEVADNRWQEDKCAYTRGCTVYQDSRFNNISLYYALSIINSRLINFYFKNFLSGDLNVFPELIKFLPIFDIGNPEDTDNDYFLNLLNNNEFEKITDQLESFIINQNYSSVHNSLSLIAERLITLSNSKAPEFDTLDNIMNTGVYKLYGLDDKQIKIIDSTIGNFNLK